MTLIPRGPYECHCGTAFDSREALVDHDVQDHRETEHEARTLVYRRYPPPA